MAKTGVRSGDYPERFSNSGHSFAQQPKIGPSWDVQQRVQAANSGHLSPRPKAPDGPNPFNPYKKRNFDPYQGYTAPEPPQVRNSLQAANINPPTPLTAMDRPLHPCRTTGSMYDFRNPKGEATDNSQLFNTDVSGRAAQRRLGGDDG